MATFHLSTFDEYGICVGQGAKTLSGKPLKCRALFFISFVSRDEKFKLFQEERPHRILFLSVEDGEL